MSNESLLDVELNNALSNASDAVEEFAEFTADFVTGDKGYSVAQLDQAYKALKESLKIAKKKGVDYKSSLQYNNQYEESKGESDERQYSESVSQEKEQ